MLYSAVGGNPAPRYRSDVSTHAVRSAAAGESRAGVGVQGAKELEALAVDFGGGAGAFAIDGQRGNADVLEVGAQPIVNESVQFDGVQALEEAADGGFAGGQ